MTEFERELLEVLRNIDAVKQASGWTNHTIEAMSERIIELEKNIHERIDKIKNHIDTLSELRQIDLQRISNLESTPQT